MHTFVDSDTPVFFGSCSDATSYHPRFLMPRFGPNVPIPDYRNDQAFTRVHLNQYAGPESDAVATHKSGHGPIRG
jgi:hypothetical protein